MIGQNQKKIGQKKIKNKPGGDANESRFGGLERELRTHKLMIVPSVNTNDCVKIEQGWNKRAKRGDVIRISIGGLYAIVERSYFEQALCAMAQGGEMIKYEGPTIK